MKKRIAAIAVCLVMALSSMSISAFAAEMNFKDVKTGDWFYNDVKFAVSTGLVNGKKADSYCPNDNLTYAEAVKLAACMHQKVTTGKISLTNGNPWYQNYLDYAKANHIVNRDYIWNNAATRAEFMYVFASALPDFALLPQNTIEDGSIPDVPRTMPEYDAIYKLYRAGIVQGSDSRFSCRPGDNIKRSELAAILTRMMDFDARKHFTIPAKPAVNLAPVVTKSGPESVNANVGKSVTISITAENASSYEWRVLDIGSSDYDQARLTKNATVTGQGTSSITITPNANWIGGWDNGRVGLYCVVTNQYGSTKSEITEIIVAPQDGTGQAPVITKSGPESIVTSVGKAISVSITAENAIGYEWRVLDIGSSDYDQARLTKNATVTGQGTATITITPNTNWIDGWDNGTVGLYCVVTNAYGSTKSELTEIIVNPAALAGDTVTAP